MGLYAFPVGTNAAVVFLFVGSVLVSSYSVKPSVGALYHFGPEGVEPQSMVNVAGRPLSGFIGGLEALGLVIKVISLSLRLIANLSAGHILTGLLYGNGSPQGLVHAGWVTLLMFPVGLALLVLEVCVCYVQGFVFCTLLTQYWADYTRASVVVSSLVRCSTIFFLFFFFLCSFFWCVYLS